MKLELPEGDENSEAIDDSSSSEEDTPTDGVSGEGEIKPENVAPVEDAVNDGACGGVVAYEG